MKTLSIFSALLLSSTLLACNKEESKDAGSKDKVEAAAKVAPEAGKVAPEATKTAAVAKADAPAHECGAAEGKAPAEHDGMDCMKKTEEMAEGEGCNQWDEAADKVSKQDVPKDAQWSVLAVSGMTCGGCERRIIANVGVLDGVVAVEADSELGQVRVAVASGNTKAPDAARAKIEELGYKLQ